MTSELSNPLAIVFAFIQSGGSEGGALADWQVRQRLAQFQSVIEEVVHQNNGTLVKSMGDVLMITFTGAQTAFQASCTMQELLDKEVQSHPNEEPLELRLGLSFGPVDIESGELGGDPVNLAYQLHKMAEPRQVLTESATLEHLGESSRSLCHPWGKIPATGGREQREIYQVLWSDDLTLLPPTDREQAPPESSPESSDVFPTTPISLALETVEADGTRTEDVAPTRLMAPALRLSLRLGDQRLELDQHHDSLVMGRGPDNDLVVADKLVSRRHAQIDYRAGQFVVTDDSVNGTYIRYEDGEQVALQNKATNLRNAGSISLGYNFDEAPPSVIYFSLQP